MAIVDRKDIPQEYVDLVEQSHPGFSHILNVNPDVDPFELEDMLDDGIPVDKYGALFTKKRPDFGPSQIKSKDELKVGDRVLLCSLPGQLIREVKITSEPYENESGNLKINCTPFKLSKDDIKPEEHFFLGDFSITPYLGVWNNWHWALKAPEEQLVSPGRIELPFKV